MSTSTKQILVATRNSGKLVEIRSILTVPGLVLADPESIGGLPDVEEDGETFEANAIKKASVLARASGMLTLADDSGLEVDALGGAPGVYSARYAGEPSNDVANNIKLLMALEGIENRCARFRCVIALVTPDGATATVDGTCEGRIAHRASGDGGFGYDPLFIPDGYSETFGALDPSIKHRVSHRGAALKAAREAWAVFGGRMDLGDT